MQYTFLGVFAGYGSAASIGGLVLLLLWLLSKVVEQMKIVDETNRNFDLLLMKDQPARKEAQAGFDYALKVYKGERKPYDEFTSNLSGFTSEGDFRTAAVLFYFVSTGNEAVAREGWKLHYNWIDIQNAKYQEYQQALIEEEKKKNKKAFKTESLGSGISDDAMVVYDTRS